MTQSVIVQKGGKIELAFPALAEGTQVTVYILPANTGGKRKFGCAKGRGKVSDDFDAPLDEFKDYS